MSNLTDLTEAVRKAIVEQLAAEQAEVAAYDRYLTAASANDGCRLRLGDAKTALLGALHPQGKGRHDFPRKLGERKGSLSYDQRPV
jgi:hypothetical protein